MTAPIYIGIATDQDDPTRYTANAGQARLGLPTRDYYLLKGEKYDSIRTAYRHYIVDLGKLAGLSDPEGAPTASSRSKRGWRRISGRPSGGATRSRPTIR